MSEIMLHGVLNMPPELWNNDSPIDVMQRHSRYVQASKYIDELERELTAAREELADWHNAAEQVKAEYPDEVHCSCVAILRKQLKHVTEQRDRLAEALQDAMEHIPSTMQKSAIEALAAVKGGSRE